MDFRTESLADLTARIAAKEISAREVVAHALSRIEALDGTVRAFVALDPEAALAEAASIDEMVADGDEIGALGGIPIAVKDLEDATGFRTTFGSVSHASDPPATGDSILVDRLRSAGCIVVGKTNTPEHGWKADTVNRLFGATHNPWDVRRSAGGSSGGSAAALAAGFVPLATGSDGGGSIRIPSAVCGLSGLKPSLGRVPHGGPAWPDWGHLSTRGPMARRVRDVVLALDVCIGPDPSDLRSLPLPDVSWTRSVESPHPPRKVAWAPTLGYARVDPEVRAVCERAVGVLADLGTEVVEIATVFEEDPLPSWLAMTATYNRRTFERLRGTPLWDEIDPGLLAMIAWGESTISPIDLVEAEHECHRLNLRLVELFHRCSLLLTPTCAGQTPLVDQPGMIDGEAAMDWVQFTYPFNLTRSPAGTVCAGFTDDGMPAGLQVIGPQHADVAVLRLMTVLEDALGLMDRLPPDPTA